MCATFKRSAAAFRVPTRQSESNHTKHKLMKIKNKKELYDAPSMHIFEVKTEGVICASGDPQNYTNPFGDEQDF